MSREHEDLELAATGVELSQLGKLEPMPADLRAKLDADAARFLAERAPPTATTPPAATQHRRGAGVMAWSGWLAAAACIALAATSWLRAPREVTKVVTVAEPAPPAPEVPTIAEQREELRKTRPDVIEVAWSPTKDPAGKSTSGNVVWSTRDQRGYMHFHGLAPNDPAKSTYQLWIFDKERDAKYPVDGGTFDIDDTGDVIVPISAKVRVHRPTLFAITVEKPHGVVVSKRERIVVTAAVN
jgi:hypothetical protein